MFIHYCVRQIYLYFCKFDLSYVHDKYQHAVHVILINNAYETVYIPVLADDFAFSLFYFALILTKTSLF